MGPLSFKGVPYSEIIDAWWTHNGGVPQEGERNVKLYQLAVNLRAICDNNKALLLQIMPRLGLDEQELCSIVDSACKEPVKGLSKMMRETLQGLNISLTSKRQSAIQCHALQPSCHIGLWYASFQHAFEVDSEVKRNLVDVVSVDKDNVVTPLCMIHTCKGSEN